MEFGLGMSDVDVTRYLYADKDVKIPGYDFTGRDLLYWIGTDLGRNKVDGDMWVDRTVNLIEQDLREGRPVIVDDVRMENEYEALRDRGAHFLRIVRDPALLTNVEKTATEGRLENRQFDATITNYGTEPALREKLWGYLKELSH